MPNSSKSRKGAQTRPSKDNPSTEMDTREDTAEPATSSVPLALTVVSRDKRKPHDLEMLQMKVEWQNEKIKALTEERDYLKTQLASVLNKVGTHFSKHSEEALCTSSKSSSNTTSKPPSDSSPDIDTSSDEAPKKKTKVMMKKKMKKSKRFTCHRAQSPKQVVSRYQKILKLFKQGGSMSAAFKHYGVDRNTVVITAAIAELCIAAPDRYEDVIKKYRSEVKLSEFAAQCAFAIKEDAEVEEKVKAYKASGNLLPFKMK